jgi:Tol biopolymer transport system component
MLLHDAGIGDPAKSDADWSPDGRQLVYVEDESALALFDFAHPRARASAYIPTKALNAEISSPAWSPDGRRVAYAASCDSAEPPCRAGIYVVGIDGSEPRRVSAGGANPGWSPDGSRIVFDDLRRGNRDIYAVNVDGTRKVRLTSAPGPDYDPTWRRSK